MNRTLRLCLALLVLTGVAASAQDSATARSLFERGRELQARRQWLQAVELYRAALQANPDYVQPMVGLAEAFFALEEYPEALDHVTRARKYDRINLELAILEGRIRVGLGQTAEARALFESVLARERNNLEARFGLAELDISLGYRREAAKRYLETLKLRPDSDKALLSLALLTDSEGDREAAAAYLETALRYHSYDPRLHYTAGRFALEMGDPDRAEQYLRIAVALDGSQSEARRLLAEALLAQGNAAAAVDMLRQVLDGHRDNALVRYTLGMAYERVGDVPGAVSALAGVLKLRPDDEIARLALENLAMSSLPKDDPVREVYAGYHLTRGRMFEQRNALARALLEYRRCLLLHPDSKEGRLAYGNVFRLLGFPVKYMRELTLLRDDLGYRDSIILDDIEIIESMSWDLVSSRWQVDQYRLEKRRVGVRVFHLVPESRQVHPRAGAETTRFFWDLLRRYESLDPLTEPEDAGSFQEAFRRAREAGSQYFVLLSVEESERSFSVRLKQYLSATGKQLASDQVYRTGNDRVLEAMDTLATRFERRLPLKGVLIDRRFDTGIVDLGRVDGLKAGEKLAVVKKGTVRLDHDAIDFVYGPADLIGEFTVGEVDENMSEGKLSRRDFFDLINPGDELLRPAKDLGGPQPAPAQSTDSLIRRLFRLVGL